MCETRSRFARSRSTRSGSSPMATTSSTGCRPRSGFEDNWALRCHARSGPSGQATAHPPGARPDAAVRVGALSHVHARRARGSSRRRRRSDSPIASRSGVGATTTGAWWTGWRVAQRVVVTDLFPTAGVAERSQRLADRVNCRVVAVDSVGVVPSASFHREEYAARTIRPKLAQADRALARAGRRPAAEAHALAVACSTALDVEWIDPAAATSTPRWRACEIDHVRAAGGIAWRALRAARARLASFVRDGLQDYSERRRNPSDADGSSRLSPYLHYGMISPLEVVRAVRDGRAGAGERRLPERDAHVARAVAQLLPAQSAPRIARSRCPTGCTAPCARTRATCAR